ncbi:MAG: hypothetical protein H6678_02385 [Candidatus Delongbacteria bacterium]|nr:hypothetical protein [Candidatus Delongbacteria bacterium]
MSRVSTLYPLILGLLLACGSADKPEPASSGSRLATLRWTATDTTRMFSEADQRGFELAPALPGSQWTVLDSLAVPGEPLPRLWLKIHDAEKTGWIDSGREALIQEEGRIATH